MRQRIYITHTQHFEEVNSLHIQKMFILKAYDTSYNNAIMRTV